MEQIPIPQKIEVKKSSFIGYGVFAKEKIKEGETIEICHLIDINSDLPYILSDYRFEYHNLENNKKYPVIPLGYGCIYNHNDSNNASWRQYQDKKLFEFYAVKDILPGEEILTYYGDRKYWENNLFYKEKKIKYSLI